MKLSFDDEESFMEAGSVLFNNPPSASDPNALLRVESGIITRPPQERNEDICFSFTLPSQTLPSHQYLDH